MLNLIFDMSALYVVSLRSLSFCVAAATAPRARQMWERFPNRDFLSHTKR
jgi:hypothetical protein